MQDQSQQKRLKATLIIQGWFRATLVRRQVKQMVSNLFKRRKIVEQLVQTQENYIRDLSIITSDFKMKMISSKIISQADAHVIFSNVDELRKLNDIFFATIFNQVQEYSHYKKIFESVYHKIHFFKIYFEYFNNFTKSSNKIDQLTKNNHRFEDFVKNIRRNQKYKMLTLKDYLIKPIQRLPKYVLIMKQIKKRTSLDHPDRLNIEKTLAMFEEVNSSNNDKLNKVINSYKISEIERNVNLKTVISGPGVQFVLEESVTILSNCGKTVELQMYLLSNQIILTKKISNCVKEKLVVNVPFHNGGATIMENEGQYFYKNSFTVQNNEGDSCTILCGSQQQKDTLVKKLFNEIMKAQQKHIQKLSTLCSKKCKQSQLFLKKMNKLDLLPDVSVLGTEERSDSMFKYTVYIVEVRIKNVRQKIFLRFNQIFLLQTFIQQKFSEVEIKNYLFKTTWIMNHKPRKIDERKMMIQRFLKEILSKRQIMENSCSVLHKLGLPSDFYTLPNRYADNEELKKSQMSQRSTGSQDQVVVRKPSLLLGSKIKNRFSIFNSDFFLDIQEQKIVPKKKRNQQKITIEEILKANQIKLGHYTRMSQMITRQSKCEQYQTIRIFLPWIQNKKGLIKVDIQMNINQRVQCLIGYIANQIGLKYYKDFRLVLQRQYAERVLDDDEYLPKVMDQMKCGKFRMMFKKLIYIDVEIEEKAMREDRVRLKIIASQVIYEAKKDKYLLSYTNYLVLAVLVGITQIYKEESYDNIVEIIHKDEFPQLNSKSLSQQCRQMLANKFTTFYNTKQTWQQDFQKTYKKMFRKLSGISRHNTTIFRQSKIQDLERQYNTTNISQLAAIMIIMQIKQNTFYGSVNHIVQISEQFRSMLEEDNQTEFGTNVVLENRNCWLVIRHDAISVFSISLTECIFEFEYEEIMKTQTHPASIAIFLRGREMDYIKLKTNNSYTIRQLLNYYKNCSELLAKLKDDNEYEDSIIELAKNNDSSSPI